MIEVSLSLIGQKVKIISPINWVALGHDTHNRCKHVLVYIVGECVCSPGYRGDACNLQDQNAPTLLKLSEDLYTDQSPTTDTAVIRLVDIQGNAFTHSDTLTCHTEQVQV